MKLSELRHLNNLKVYSAILQGNDTHSKIIKCTGISRFTVSEITNDLVRRNFLNLSIPKRTEVGRRINKYSATNKYFCIFIDKQDDCFSIIGIDTSGNANIRFEYSTNHNGQSAQEVFDNFVLYDIKNSEIFEYCMAIYLINGKEIIVNDEIIKTTKEDLIVTSLSNTEKAILFEINNKCIMSLYGHIHYSDTDRYTLCKYFSFDEFYTIQGNLYYEAFHSLQILTKKAIEKII